MRHNHGFHPRLRRHFAQILHRQMFHAHVRRERGLLPARGHGSRGVRRASSIDHFGNEHVRARGQFFNRAARTCVTRENDRAMRRLKPVCERFHLRAIFRGHQLVMRILRSGHADFVVLIDQPVMVNHVRLERIGQHARAQIFRREDAVRNANEIVRRAHQGRRFRRPVNLKLTRTDPPAKIHGQKIVA
jgi:hypothetical protein